MSEDNITDLSVVRFHKNTKPDAHDPVTALDAARAWLDACKKAGEPAEHVIVLIGRNYEGENSGSGTRYFQAGKYHYHAQFGLVQEGALMLREGASDE